jgi:hypothetical protein
VIKQTGKATNMKKMGSDESGVTHVNAPFRDLHKGGHDLNHGYKNPAANASGVNMSYAHPLVNPAKENSPNAQIKGNAIKPLSQMGLGKK